MTEVIKHFRFLGFSHDLSTKSF